MPEEAVAEMAVGAERKIESLAVFAPGVWDWQCRVTYQLRGSSLCENGQTL